MPEGKGNPIKKDKGEMIKTANINFAVNENDMVKLRTGVSRNE